MPFRDAIPRMLPLRPRTAFDSYGASQHYAQEVGSDARFLSIMGLCPPLLGGSLFIEQQIGETHFSPWVVTIGVTVGALSLAGSAVAHLTAREARVRVIESPEEYLERREAEWPAQAQSDI